MEDVEAEYIQTAVDYEYVYKWMVKRLEILGFVESDWNSNPQNRSSIANFISHNGPKTLSIVKDENSTSLHCDETGNSVMTKGLRGYFLRTGSDVNVYLKLPFKRIKANYFSLFCTLFCASNMT
jgi:hypothetical protein